MFPLIVPMASIERRIVLLSEEELQQLSPEWLEPSLKRFLLSRSLGFARWSTALSFLIPASSAPELLPPSYWPPWPSSWSHLPHHLRSSFLTQPPLTPSELPQIRPIRISRMQDLLIWSTSIPTYRLAGHLADQPELLFEYPFRFILLLLLLLKLQFFLLKHSLKRLFIQLRIAPQHQLLKSYEVINS